MKQCNSCMKEKPDTEFQKRKFASGNYGIRGTCRECIYNAAKISRDTPQSKEKRYKAHLAWRTKNRSKVLEYKKLERLRNIETIKKYRSKYISGEVGNYVALRIIKGSQLNISDIPKELVDAKLIQLIINRKLKEIKNEKHK